MFRDEEERAAATDPSPRIDEALRRAGALIIVCSPRTPSSRWVDAEVWCFVALGRSDRDFAVLVDGEPAQSFPPSLLAQGREPRAADLRVPPGEEARDVRRLASLARSPDGRWALRASEEDVGGWVLQSAALVRASDGNQVALFPHEWMIRLAAFTADDRWFVTATAAASADAQSPCANVIVGQTVRVWSTDDRGEATRLSLAAERGIATAAVSPIGEWLAAVTEGADGNVVRLWPVLPARLRELARSLLQHNVSTSEWQTFVRVGAPRATCPGLPVTCELRARVGRQCARGG